MAQNVLIEKKKTHAAVGRLEQIAICVQKIVLCSKTRLLEKKKTPAAVGRLKTNANFVNENNYYGQKTRLLRKENAPAALGRLLKNNMFTNNSSCKQKRTFK